MTTTKSGCQATRRRAPGANGHILTAIAAALNGVADVQQAPSAPSA
ncbi:MAG: hypothetical protein U0841_29665 [Chloroflexia bacterium]